MSGESRIALMAGMIVTWLQKMEKFSMPSAAARSTVMAVDGAVVSNPIALKTTRLSGLSRATLREASGGDTIRVSAPLAFGSKNGPLPPATGLLAAEEGQVTA